MFDGEVREHQELFTNKELKSPVESSTEDDRDKLKQNQKY